MRKNHSKIVCIKLVHLPYLNVLSFVGSMLNKSPSLVAVTCFLPGRAEDLSAPSRIYQSLHVSGDYVPIIRSNTCVYATLGTCYSVWMTVWYSPHSRPKHVEILVNR